MKERALRPDEKPLILDALLTSAIAPEPICREAVDTCRFIPFGRMLPPVTEGVRPVIAFFMLRHRASGIALGRRVYVRRHLFGSEGHLPIGLMAHEVAHVVQFLRDGTVPFVTRYVGEYLRARLRGRRDRQAYLSISYEREARRVETNLAGH